MFRTSDLDSQGEGGVPGLKGEPGMKGERVCIQIKPLKLEIKIGMND